MDYLQYKNLEIRKAYFLEAVLNLIINGLPSIPKLKAVINSENGFKPYYKWITFNTI